MWTRGSALSPASKKSGLQGATRTCAFPHFPGSTHTYMSNVCWHSGGGSEKNTELNNAAVPVLWMGNEALFAGLKLRDSKVVWDWAKLAETRPKESLVHVWHFFELLPFKRLSYDKRANTW